MAKKIRIKHCDSTDDIGKLIIRTEQLICEMVEINGIPGDVVRTALASLLGKICMVNESNVDDFCIFVTEQIRLTHEACKE